MKSLSISEKLKIIFLDFDGVLDTVFYDSYLERHNQPSCDESGRPVFDPLCVAYLNRIVESTDADIVVSSDWKYFDSLTDLREMWNQRNLPGQILDVTPNIRDTRGKEIAEWLQCHSDVTNYVIVDDLGADNFYPEQLDSLVVVNPYCGIDDSVCERTIKILSRRY